MKYVVVLVMAVMLAGCSKNGEVPEVCFFPTDPGWLQKKKAESASCTCLTQIRQGVWQGMLVYEIKLIDPLCNGIPAVYKVDGSPAIDATKPAEYALFLAEVKQLEVIWTCTK